MQINKEILKARMEKRGVTVSDMASALEIDESTYYRKINSGGVNFSVKQVNEIAKVLNLSKKDCINIFFADKLAETREVSRLSQKG
jgi:transcriptional regulator with XRE-family HTH domain